MARDMAKELFDIVVKIKHRTEKAVLVTVDDDNEEWLPLSQIEVDDNKDGTHTVTAPVWLLTDKGLI